ncbi:hypothetical protein BD410DRAFT_845340 [Rickenella mellea]|uniref:F-box domain-containing protein n=1 Tax=Rickenella mellea TaxID=50990 RepID=A0A4Y7PIE6_9AGAM|nr:hypothetical protein BD410DRAFT_845340 [Rickenella mellea]
MRTAEPVDLSAVHHISPIPPICRISAEVALEIFECCLLEDEFSCPSIRSAPLQLSHVCHTWRKLAITTPLLWCKLRLTDDHWVYISRRISPEVALGAALEMWMGRAGELRMSVLIRYLNVRHDRKGHFLPDFTNTERVPPIFRIIVNNPTRWKELRLNMPSRTVIRAWDFVQQHVIDLEALEIADINPPMDCQKSWHSGFMGIPESIAETLSTLSVRAAIDSPDTPLVRLRRLSLKSTAIDGCLCLLNNCPSLEDLIFEFCNQLNSTADEIISVPAILLPRLRSIHLTHCENCESKRSSLDGDGEIGQFLDRLQLPQLKEFYLSMTVIGSEGSAEPNLPWDDLSRLITRSNCSLNRLELRSPHIVASSVLECLRLSPDLKHLSIPADEELERNIAQLLPGLESLRIFDKWD